MPTRTSTSGQARPRHVPQRTCVACRRTGDQRTFVRLVRSPEGPVHVDERGKAPGRGAYLCRTAACWERGVKGPLAASLRTNIDSADREALRAYGARFDAPTAPSAPVEGGADDAAAPPGPTESGVA